MISYGDEYIYRFEDPEIYKHNKKYINSIGGNFAGHVSKESTQAALNAFHNIGSTVQNIPTKALIEQLTTKKTILRFNLKDPTYDNCNTWRSKNKYNILNESIGIFKSIYDDTLSEYIYYIDKNVGDLYGITEDFIQDMYKELEIVKDDNGIKYYKRKYIIKKQGIGIPCLINTPYIPPIVEINKDDIIRTYDVIDTYQYNHEINDQIDMYIPIDDLIAYGYIVSNKHTIWTFGKPVKLIRHKHGDILVINPYIEQIYYTLVCDLSHTESKSNFVQKMYIKLHNYNDIILSSILLTNLSPAWFSLYCTNHFENYRSTLYIIRDILKYDFENINIHKTYTLHLISNGFRKYSNNDISTLIPISTTVSNFIKSGSTKKSMFTSPLISELTGRDIKLKHPFDIITTIPSKQDDIL